jgi:beta-glucosidase
MVGPVGGSGWVSGQTVASSFDKALVATQAQAMALEFKQKGYGQQLGPVTGPFGRSVFSGRLFEGMVS